MKNKTNDSSTLENITADEIAKLKDFLVELDRVEAQRSSAFTNFRQRVHAAKAAYYACSSDENFTALRTALVEENVAHAISKVLLDANSWFLKGFAERTFQPFVRPIIERLLTPARSVLEKTTAAENERHETAFGQPLHPQQETAAIAAARGNVNVLEHLLVIASRPLIDQSIIRQIVNGLYALRAG